MTAPSLFIPDPASVIYVQGEIGKGGIVVRSVAEAVTLAEALLDWAYKDDPKEPDLWPWDGRVAHFMGKDSGLLRILHKDPKRPGVYNMLAHPESRDFKMRGKERAPFCNTGVEARHFDAGPKGKKMYEFKEDVP